MSSVPVSHAIALSGILFVIGLAGVIARRNLVFILMSIEIMLSAPAAVFVAAASRWKQPDGQVMVILILVVAAAEVAIGLSLLLRIYHYWKSTDIDEISLMKG